ncbi:MAG: tetratricopeptide repeat protein [Candidatus Hydrogenedentota bacterium]
MPTCPDKPISDGVNGNKIANQRVRIDQVGGPRSTWLELKGTVLVYHVRTWAASFSAYIPVEWITVSRRRRRHSLGLLRNLSLLVAALAAGGALALLTLQPMEESIRPVLTNPFVQAAAIAAAVFAMGAAVWFGMNAWLAAYERPPTTLLRVEDSDMAIEFWHRKGPDQHLDHFLERLNASQEKAGHASSYPPKMGHARRHIRPWRAVALKAAVVTGLLYIPCNLTAAYLGRPELMLFLVLPPIVYFGKQGLDWLGTRFEPKALQHGLRHFHKGEFEQAEHHLAALLRENPRHQHGLILHTQTLIMLERFEEAFRNCQRIEDENPEMAAMLREDLWALKRMHERMEAGVEGAEE